MKFKGFSVVLFVFAASIFMGITAYAGSWRKDAKGWWYDYGNGTWPAGRWEWIDGNNDGVSECYYFGDTGYCLIDTVTPDGYYVNASGAWTDYGEVIVKRENRSMYSIENITELVKQHYLKKHGYNPPHIELYNVSGNNLSYRIYEMVDQRMVTLDWYYIDRSTAIGNNFTGEYVKLVE